MEKRTKHPLTLFYRVYQFVFRAAMYFLPWRCPEVVSGEGSIARLPEAVARRGVANVLVVTDKTVSGLGLLDALKAGLEARRIQYAVFDETMQNPTIPCVMSAYAAYKDGGCGGVIAVGGGSVMDCAKAVCAKAARPNMPVKKMMGQLKVLRKLPPMFAVPTTSGTGSEVTLAAVIVDPETHEKASINDPSLFPAVAVLDPAMTAGMPPHLTATTGMDALTHAVEAYIGRCNTAKTRAHARESVKLVFENLTAAYEDGHNMEARNNMQHASFEAGAAFTRAFVGNVHAVAHTLGGYYNVPHGLANAVILPYVLDAYGARAHKRLAELAGQAGISGDTPKEKAEAFIQAIRDLNARLGIPNHLDCIRQTDVPAMCLFAHREANPTYPVPVIFTKADFAEIYEAVRTGGQTI